MKGIPKSDILLSLLISLSYFIFWWLVIFISASGNFTSLQQAIAPFSWQIIYVTFINLLLHLIALPFIRTKRIQWLWSVSLVIVLLALLTIGFKSWNRLGEFVSVYPQSKSVTSNMDSEVKNVLFQLFGLGYFASIKFFLDSFKLKLKNQELAIEKNNAELNFLKSQTNPHFLFNTLNNIYLLTRDKSDLAPDTVLRLSDILRYMLYETESDLVTIDKEIKVIEDYLALEKIRYDDSLHLNLRVDMDDEKQEIPPLLMIPLIENAFKHGVSETLLAPFINICLTIQKETLLFTVENSTREQETGGSIKENIGIRNLRRQLQLLFSEHTLTVEQRQQTFFASMFINLKSYAKN